MNILKVVVVVLIDALKIGSIHLDCSETKFREKDLVSITFSIECLRQVFCDFGGICFSASNGLLKA